ncbi:hypothetical protein FACS1894164_09260 [Spirochaetia bacterium]|nr:hypothetical protein FACS1894164_09260 [Spirochaetia bacterium]
MVVSLPALEWYRSNAAGSALEPVMQSEAAQYRYALSVETIPLYDLPASLQSLYESSYRAELRLLLESGTESNRYWYAYDSTGALRLTAEQPRNASSVSTIECYDNAMLLIESRHFSGDNETNIIYTYKDTMLIQTETYAVNALGRELVVTDSYRYRRDSTLRSIEREYHSDEPAIRLSFLSIDTGSATNPIQSNPVLGVDSAFVRDILVSPTPHSRNEYRTDAQGRITHETQFDETGAVTGEWDNTWDGTRLKSVRWRSGSEDRLIEYEYDSEGKRIAESNYNQGILERTLRMDPSGPDREIEEIYLDGKAVLRAVWEHGRKIREERIR